jgi:hypothetical protein
MCRGGHNPEFHRAAAAVGHFFPAHERCAVSFLYDKLDLLEYSATKKSSAWRMTKRCCGAPKPKRRNHHELLAGMNRSVSNLKSMKDAVCWFCIDAEGSENPM